MIKKHITFDEITALKKEFYEAIIQEAYLQHEEVNEEKIITAVKRVNAAGEALLKIGMSEDARAKLYNQALDLYRNLSLSFRKDFRVGKSIGMLHIR